MKKIILLVLLVVLSGCVDIESPLIINKGDVLPADISDKLDTVVVIHKTGCPACAVAVPILEELEEELDLEFDYYNMAIEDERNELLELGFVSRYVPTIVVDGEVYIGALEKETYKGLIEAWLAG